MYLGWFCFGGFLGAAVGNDLWSYRLPNSLMLFGFFLGLCCSALSGGISGLGSSLLGSLVGFAILFLPFSLGLLGGGDVKFLWALGAFLGPTLVLWTLLYGMLAGGVLAILYWFTAARSGKARIPYGVAFAVGGLYIALERGLLAAGVVR